MDTRPKLLNKLSDDSLEKQEQEAFINEQIDLMKACIHCGMCLPACPTYLETANEGNSPRGRLYLIKDLLTNDQSDLSNKAVNYLDNCLNCRACETACPSGVEYGELLGFARSDKGQSRYHKGFFGFIRKLAFKFVLPYRWVLNSLRSIIALVSAIYRKYPKLAKLSKLQPDLKFDYKKIETNKTYRSHILVEHVSDEDRTLSMPLGCVMDTVYNNVHWDTIKVLNHYGYHVYIPETDCCGALAHHSGEHEIGHRQLEKTCAELEKNSYPVVYNSAGCGAYVKEYAKVYDLIEILTNSPHKPEFTNPESARSNKLKLTYHPACHLNHVQGLSDDYLNLLKTLPDIEIMPLTEADVCCGSAGIYNLIKPEMADDIGTRKAEFIKETGAHVIVTANPGCMSQIQGHLGKDYKVIHPVTLLAKFLA